MFGLIILGFIMLGVMIYAYNYWPDLDGWNNGGDMMVDLLFTASYLIPFLLAWVIYMKYRTKDQ